MKHNLQIRVSKKPLNDGVASFRQVSIRKRLLRFLLGDKQKLTVLVPGDSVQALYINEVEENFKRLHHVNLAERRSING